MKIKFIIIFLFIITFIILIKYKCQCKCKETFLLQSEVKNRINYEGNIDTFIENLENAFCLNNKYIGILISILNTDSQSNTLYIDGSGSIFSNFSNGSRKLYGNNERIGLIWEPDNIIHFTSKNNCMYPSDGATAGRTENGKINRCYNNPGQTPVPIMCNNSLECIQEGLNIQKKNCNNNINCNYNEFVINKDLDTIYNKKKEKVEYSPLPNPSSLVYIISDQFFKYNYSDDYNKINKTFTDDTTIIIIILNQNNYPTFQHTTVQNFVNYFSDTKQDEINRILKRHSNTCNA